MQLFLEFIKLKFVKYVEFIEITRLNWPRL